MILVVFPTFIFLQIIESQSKYKDICIYQNISFIVIVLLVPVLCWQFEKLLFSSTNILKTSVMEAGRCLIRAKLFMKDLFFLYR